MDSVAEAGLARVGRELRMVELKEMIRELKERR